MLIFNMPGAAGAAIQIDEPSLFPEAKFEAEGKRVGKGFQFRVTTDEVGARIIRRECIDRLAMQGGEGFDDPKSWLPALRRAIVNIDKALGTK
jgi:hypothetical protein